MRALLLSRTKCNPHRRLQAPTFSSTSYTTHEPDGGQGHAGERPERRSGGRDGRARVAGPPSGASRQLSVKRRGLGRSPSRPGSSQFLGTSWSYCFVPLRSAASLRRSVIYPLSHEHEHPSSRVSQSHTQLSKARITYRADPFSDEDIEAGAGSRYPCFLVSTHQLASARCRATATAALPWFLLARSRS
jgi:hypothetical protein